VAEGGCLTLSQGGSPWRDSTGPGLGSGLAGAPDGLGGAPCTAAAAADPAASGKLVAGSLSATEALQDCFCCCCCG